MFFLQQLANSAGYTLNLASIPKSAWIEACASAHLGRYDDLAQLLFAALTRT
jgi:hypothetical protein